MLFYCAAKEQMGKSPSPHFPSSYFWHLHRSQGAQKRAQITVAEQIGIPQLSYGNSQYIIS